MESTNISRKDLLKERKKRKILKQKAKKWAVLFPFLKKAICIGFFIIILGVWVIIDGKLSRPSVKPEETFLYIGECVEAFKWDRRSITGRGRRISGIDICFEDGRKYTWNYDQFSNSEIEGMVGSELFLTMAKKANGDEIPVAVSHENGYVYCTLEEYNMAVKEYRKFSFGSYCFCSISIYILLLIVWYPRKWIP